MLKLVGFLIKLMALSAVILVVGNLVHWRGKTVSDQVKNQITQVERSKAFNRVRDISEDLIEDTKAAPTVVRQKISGARSVGDEIPVSERQKLKALIRELNGSTDSR